MDSALIKNLGASKDLAPAAPTRAESAKKEPAKAQRSFDSVLAERAQPAPNDDTAPAAESPDTAPAVPLKAPVARKLKSAGEADASENESAWAEFLTEMDEQLNVKPTDVLAAFEKLSEDDLQAKPEDTTDQMVAAMGLTGQAALLAKQLLGKLIQQTDPAAGAMNESAASIDSAPPAPLPTLDRASQAFATETASADENSDLVASNTLAEITAGTDDAPKSVGQDAPALKPEANTAAMNALVEQMTPVKDGDAGSALPKVDQLVRDIVARQTVNTAPPVNASETDSADNAKSTVTAPRSSQQALDAMISKAMKHATDQESARDGDSEEDGDVNDQLLTNADVQSVRSTKSDFATKLSNGVDGAGQAAPAAPTDLIENARLMVRNGGGEMKVTVNSEVGEIEMKVSVSGGKVSVQMVAETDEAKQILETQLGDLKTQLTAHQLQVDKLQVDTSSNLGQQSEQDSSRSNHRSNFGENFNPMNQQNSGRQQGQARRQSNDPALPRAYGNTAARPKPAAVQAAPAGSTNSRRLNVVA